MRQTHPLPNPKLTRRTAIAAIGLSCVLFAGCSSGSSAPTSSASSSAAEVVQVGGSVISTAGSSNEMNIVLPDPITADLTALGGSGSGVEWVAVAGDGTTSTEPAGLTGDGLTGLTTAMNADQAAAPGRTALAGLAAIKSPAGSPVWVFSPMLDTMGPLDFNQLAFEESPPVAVQAVTDAGKLPDLQGREVTFVVSPVAGEQKKLSDLQVGYLHAIWEGVATAAGASKVTFFDGTGSTPGTGTIPPVPVPDPNDKINSEAQGATRTCTLPSPALFVPDTPNLIDKAATLTALGECLGTLDATTKITVEGHTAGVAGGGDEQTATDLSTQRATEVAALLRELGVPAENVTSVVGYGASKPLVEPASDPANRAVVVTFTSAG
jgi:outer membrane protein OmpA-like peptidoglycan-associated protein